MKWNAFENIEPAINKTKQLLFPFNFKYWFKLSIVSALSGNVGGGNGGGGDYKLPSSDVSSDKGITGRAISESTKTAGLIGILVAFFALLVVAFGIITSIFKFIFLDALFNKKYSIRKSWKENGSKGLSYFGFSVIFFLIMIAGYVIIFLPVIIPLIKDGFTNYFSRGFLDIFLSLLPSLILALIWFVITAVFNMFVRDFVLVDMYTKKLNATLSLKRVFGTMKYQKTESLVYWLSRIVLSIATSIISLIVFVVVFLIFLVPGLLFYFILGKVLIMFIFLVVILAILAIIIILLLLLPVNVFLRYYNILGYNSLMKK